MNVLQIKLKLGDDTPAHWFDVDSIDFFNDRVCFVDGVGESVDIEYQCEPLRFAPPSLTDDQQVVLEWLKYPLNDIPNRFAKNYFAYVTCLFLGQAPDKVLKAYQELSPEQQFQVLAAFAEWGGRKYE